MKFFSLFAGLVFFLLGTSCSLQAFLLESEQEETLENSMDNKIDTNDRLRSSSSPDITSSLDHSNAGEAAAGSLQGVSVTPVTSSVLYRLSKGGWQESDLTKEKSEEQWKPTDRFASNDRGEGTWNEVPIDDRRDFPLMFIEKYNRADDIEKKITAYQKDLNEEQIKVPSIESEDRVYLLKHLIPTLNRARIYQNEMVQHLAKQDYSNDKKTAVLQASDRLERTIQINENPNKIEKIASQLEQHYDEIVLSRGSLDILQKHIDALPSNKAALEQLLEAHLQKEKQLLNEIIGHCQTLIEQKAAYAQTLEAPCKASQATDQSTQERIDQYALKFTEEENKISEKQDLIELNGDLRREWGNQCAGLSESQIEKEKKQAHPQERVIQMYTRSKEMFQQAAAANDETARGYFLSNAGRAFLYAANEMKRLVPRGRVIEMYTRSAECSQQAAAADDETVGNNLSGAGVAFLDAANEMKRLNPRERVIEMYTRSAECSQQAAAASDETVRDYLSGATMYFYYAAKEARELNPRERLIEIDTRLAEVAQQAAAASDETVRGFLNVAVKSFYNATEEEMEANPREDIINSWLQKANEAIQMASLNS